MSAPRQPDPNVYDEQYYKETYGDQGLKKFDLHWWAVRWYASMVERCLRDIDGSRVLEIGCGHGFMLGRLEKKYKTFGVDLSTYAIDQTARFAPDSTCAVANIEDGIPAHLEPGGFDVIVAKYVFEHLHDPLQAMRHAATLLSAGGILLIAVPNTESLGARRKGAAWFAHPEQDPTHCSLFSPLKWLEIVRESGLECCKESADGYWDIPYFERLPRWLQAPLFLGPTALACLSGRAILPPRFGENLLIFARKPGAKSA
jgi:SAM-dependent methyltransferase